ncbi:Coxsackievirus and adenovirus receptor [Merluccius polli]|uniref:Coxsackievirus and adenovirus receptor n=1 Tax=Merluccius polli TaxID=89951 RepID=A0AA47N4Y3_MERPO|nr:Coxsackievirus and adenovirus receptor [Merluccius polli]
MEPNVFCCAVVLFAVMAGMASSLEITSKGPGSIVVASGHTVKLECHFTLAPEDFAPLDIEWSLLAPDNQNEEKVVILYYGDRAYEDYPFMKGRVQFNMADPKNGDASINLTGLRLSDTGTYRCKVKKAPGIRSRKILLTVMVKPSRPRCYAEGPTEQGKDVVLRCVCEEGTIPLRYTWEKISDSKLLPASAVLDAVGGTMNVRNALTSVSGTYRCKATNRVGNEECILHVNITPPAGIIAGAIIAVLLILIIIAIILFCCCRARQRKKYDKEICNEIREDASPPRRRVRTARSFTSEGNHRSSLGSVIPSNLHRQPRPAARPATPPGPASHTPLAPPATPPWTRQPHPPWTRQPHPPGPASHTPWTRQPHPPWPRQPHPPGPASHTPPGPASHTPPGPASHTPPGPASDTPPGPSSHTPPGPSSHTPPGPASHTPPGPASHTPPGPSSHTPPGPASHTPLAPPVLPTPAAAPRMAGPKPQSHGRHPCDDPRPEQGRRHRVGRPAGSSVCRGGAVRLKLSGTK